MGYFSNGIEAAEYLTQYCSNCQNWTKREGEEEAGCPIWDMHYIDNYELCNDEDSYLDKLIPISEDGLFNEKCVMYLPKE